jgi:hypothetical protein
LFKTPHTESDIKKIEGKLQRLINKGIIRNYGSTTQADVWGVQDVIIDLLVSYYSIPRSSLKTKGSYEECPVEWVLGKAPTILVRHPFDYRLNFIGSALEIYCLLGDKKVIRTKRFGRNRMIIGK